MLKLEKSARFIYLKLLQLPSTPPLNKLPPELMGKDVGIEQYMTSYEFPSMNEQIQRLYSESYYGFRTYIKWASQHHDKVFVNEEVPFVSTGDIQSTHAYQYAYGIKIYAGHEDERLRPEWDRDGKAHRPYSGAVFITIHPLSDYTFCGHNHVPSMNSRVDLVVSEQVNPERENQFYSRIVQDRVKYILVAKYPSFHRKKYLETFLLKYGLTKDMYEKFRIALLKTKPHETKRKLLTLLLGEYLSAYQTKHCISDLSEFVGERVLIYRDRNGNFSLEPTNDISPCPAGDEDPNRLRRNYTHDKREARKRKSSENSSDISPIARKRVKYNDPAVEAANSFLKSKEEDKPFTIDQMETSGDPKLRKTSVTANAMDGLGSTKEMAGSNTKAVFESPEGEKGSKRQKTSEQIQGGSFSQACPDDSDKGREKRNRKNDLSTEKVAKTAAEEHIANGKSVGGEVSKDHRHHHHHHHTTKKTPPSFWKSSAPIPSNATPPVADTPAYSTAAPKPR
jgi:hypothetical protein